MAIKSQMEVAWPENRNAHGVTKLLEVTIDWSLGARRFSHAKDTPNQKMPLKRMVSGALVWATASATYAFNR